MLLPRHQRHRHPRAPRRRRPRAMGRLRGLHMAAAGADGKVPYQSHLRGRPGHRAEGRQHAGALLPAHARNLKSKGCACVCACACVRVRVRVRVCVCVCVCMCKRAGKGAEGGVCVCALWQSRFCWAERKGSTARTTTAAAGNNKHGKLGMGNIRKSRAFSEMACEWDYGTYFTM